MTITPADALDLAIARGPPQQDLGGQISKLPDSYWAGLDEAYKRRNQDAFKDGVPMKDGAINTTALYDTLLKAGGTAPAVEVGKQLTQQDTMRALQGMGGAVFPGSQPTPAAPQPAPMQQPPVSRAPGGDNGATTVMSAVAPHFGEADAGRPALAIAQRLGVDPNKPLSPDQFAQAQQLAQTAAQARRPQQPVPTESPGTAGVENDPTLGGLVPPGRTVEQHLGMLRKAAALAQSTGVRDAGKSYIDAIDAIQKRLQPTEQQKNYLANKRPGESNADYEARVAADKVYATKTTEDNIKNYDTIREAGKAAAQILPQVNFALGLTKDKNFYSGSGEAYNLALKKLAVTFGADPNTAVPQEAVRKVISGNIANGLQSFRGLGQIRNAEISLITQATASLDNTPQALRALLTIQQRVQQRALDVAKLAQNYNGGRLDTGFDRKLAEYDQKNPLIKDSEIDNFRNIFGGVAAPKEGATAVNGKGERIILRNGKWEPLT